MIFKIHAEGLGFLWCRNYLVSKLQLTQIGHNSTAETHNFGGRHITCNANLCVFIRLLLILVDEDERERRYGDRESRTKTLTHPPALLCVSLALKRCATAAAPVLIILRPYDKWSSLLSHIAAAHTTAAPTSRVSSPTLHREGYIFCAVVHFYYEQSASFCMLFSGTATVSFRTGCN